MIDLYRERYEHYGHGNADQAIVGLGGQIFMHKNSQEAIRRFRPYFDNAPVYGGGPSLEDFMDQTPLTVGSPSRSLKKPSPSETTQGTTSASSSSSTMQACPSRRSSSRSTF